MRLLITSFLLCTLSASTASACLVATQVRRIVLGATGDIVHVLEVDVIRDGRLETGVEWFHLTPRRVTLTWVRGVPKQVVQHTWPQRRANTPDEARATLRKAFDRAIAQVENGAGFEKAVVTARWQCDFLRSCAPFTLEDKGLRQANMLHPVPAPDLIIKRTEYEGGVQLAKAGIEGVDAMRVGDRTLYAVTVGWGWDQDPCAHVAPPCADRRTRTAQPVTPDPRAHITHRRGLHHGKEWDVIVPQRGDAKSEGRQ
jgi:hypothetical protein